MESVVTLSHSYLTPRAQLSNVLSHPPDLHADVHISVTDQAFISSEESIAGGLMLLVLFCFVFLNLVLRNIVTAEGPQYSTALSALLLFKNSCYI